MGCAKLLRSLLRRNGPAPTKIGRLKRVLARILRHLPTSFPQVSEMGSRVILIQVLAALPQTNNQPRGGVHARSLLFRL